MPAATCELEREIELSIVMPCLNEVETLGACIRTASGALREHGIAGEIVVADNGSTDGSRAVARRLGVRLALADERGYGKALMAGISAARGRYVLIGDADGSYDFRELPVFLDKLRNGYDLVQGCRLERGGGRVLPGAMPALHRHIGNPLISWTAHPATARSTGWWAARRGELRPNTQLDYEWRLKKHLLAFFADIAICEIDIDTVDQYRENKVIEREKIRLAATAGHPLKDKRGQRRVPMSNESINNTLVLLANVLDSAVERGGLETNPARGKRRRLRAPRPTRRVLEPDELNELLAVAGQMDRQKRRALQIGRRPMIAVMAKTGVRVTELCQLRWRAVDIHHERLIIEQAKTDAGKRQVDLTLDLIDELNAWRAERASVELDGFVFATASGKPRNKDNVRTALSRVVERANEHREARGQAPLPPVVPHTLRRTYISLMLEAGAPLHYVMDQVGHEDSKTTLEIYAQVQKRLSRTKVKRAFEELLAGPELGDPGIPAEAREKMSDQAQRTVDSAQTDPRRAMEVPGGPRKWSTEADSTPRG